MRGRPRVSGHGQPHLPADLGSYDFGLGENRAAQAGFARTAGLLGFCYYHYWFAGRRLLHAPFDAVLAAGKPDFPFMFFWAKQKLDVGLGRRGARGAHRPALLRHQHRHLAPALADPRYIRVRGPRTLPAYNSDKLHDARRWTYFFRETLRAEGLHPFLIRVEPWLNCDTRPPAAVGFDVALDFQPFSRCFQRLLAARPDLKTAPFRHLAHRLRREWGRGARSTAVTK